MPRLILLVLLAVAGLPLAASAATIYKCTGPTGATVFSQVPCGNDAAAIGANGSSSAPRTPAAEASNDKAALADIDARCDAQSHKILDSYAAQFAEANASIAEMHKHLMVPGAKGSEKDPATQKQINVVEAQKTDLLGSQDRELSALRNQCQMDHNVALKRRADHDATRAMAKR